MLKIQIFYTSYKNNKINIIIAICSISNILSLLSMFIELSKLTFKGSFKLLLLSEAFLCEGKPYCLHNLRKT